MSEYLDLLKLVLTGLAYGDDMYIPVQAGSAAKRAVTSVLKSRGMTLSRRVQVDRSLRDMGRDWPSIGYTMIGTKRLNNVQHAIETALAESIPGDVCECGVWRGGCAMFMRATLNENRSDRVVWAADSFAGMLKPNVGKYPIEATAKDMSDLDYLSVPLERVEENFRRFGLLSGVRFLKGWFSETLPTAPIERLAVLRADGDLYESTMDILNNLYAKVSPGGFVIIDDYHSWEPCRKAVSDFRTATGANEPLMPIDKDAVFWRKH